jgi:hypothetical protein
MKKLLASALMICVGVLAVGCDGETKPTPKVPQSDLGEPAKDGPKTTPTPAPKDVPKTAPAKPVN